MTVAVAIVTYGERSHLLARVADGLRTQTAASRIGAVCVCDNGAGPGTKAYLAAVAREWPQVQVVTVAENLGSAGGYKRAIAAAGETGAEYIWCLDDDNVPEPDALERLFEATRALGREAALFALREDRGPYRQLAATGRLEDAFGHRYNFLGLSLAGFPKAAWRRLALWRARPGARAPGGAIDIPYAAYGGFFFPARHLREVGLPREAMQTGVDDREFTSRFVARGHPIYLVPASRVRDVDDGWSHRRGLRALLGHRILFDGEADKLARIYVPVRNGVWFRSYVLGWRRHPLYRLNGALYLAGMLAQAVVMRVCGHRLAWRSFIMVVRGVRDGATGRVPWGPERTAEAVGVSAVETDPAGPR
jgi:GT2 family glycosyltransferase